jgi:peroxiredoxin
VADEGFQYEVWKDDGAQLSQYYGAMSGPVGSPARITKVLDANGNLILEYPQVLVGTHPQDVLEDMQALFGP